MQLSIEPALKPSATVLQSEGVVVAETQRDPRYAEYKVIRRNGAVVRFEPTKISVAVTKAFIAVNGGNGAASARVRELVTGLSEQVVGALLRRQPLAARST